ncbi:MAG: peptidylprolyl isomerase [Chitinophagaceae bacterium]|nr:peptidylprolyl isomerase [Chitinophagaceae bacterium]MCW5904758.1 peptidylprolyl isomerase [Chitinophagaceae bacterium]
MKHFLLLLSVVISSITINAQATKKKTTTRPATPKVTQTATTTPVSKERLVEITTDYGIMIARLYDATPLHRDNFIKLIQKGFYDSLLFHRVIKGFMIQGGDPVSKHADSLAILGGGEVTGQPRIPAEFNHNLIHKKGALAAARDGNPEKASSNCQFYIVQGNKIDTAQLRQMYEQRIKPNNPNFSYTEQQKEMYHRIGGTPFLDQNYTVFGEIISGLNVIDKIASLQTRPGDRPIKDVRMKIRMLN